MPVRVPIAIFILSSSLYRVSGRMISFAALGSLLRRAFTSFSVLMSRASGRRLSACFYSNPNIMPASSAVSPSVSVIDVLAVPPRIQNPYNLSLPTIFAVRALRYIASRSAATFL